jgi:hypothetical protein
MTINLYITSTQSFSGKSAVCVTFMHRMRKDGYKVGYLKPFSSAARVMAESGIDEDARFVKQTFKLVEPLELLAPVVLTNQTLRKIMADGDTDYRHKVQEAAQKVGAGKDIVIMEGSANFHEGYIVDLSPKETVRLVDAKVIAVVGYQDSLQVVDDILNAQVYMKEFLLGVIVNNVPPSRMGYMYELVAPYVQKQGVNLLSVLPHEQILHSVSVHDIAEHLEAELLCGHDCNEELIENLMVAAMNVEQALNHFHRVPNKVVIVGSDRPDIQLAALETSTKALILTGHTPINPMIQAKAEERSVAIIFSPHDTLPTVEKVERFFGRARFHQFEKVEHFEFLLNNTLDFNELYRLIGLK